MRPSAPTLLLLLLLAGGCRWGQTEQPKDESRERYSKLCDRAEHLFKRVAKGSEREAREALTQLCTMLEHDENSYSYTEPYGGRPSYWAVAYIGYFPNYRGLMGEQSHLSQSKSGCELLDKAVPRIISLMKNGESERIDHLLRALQGASPEGHDWEAWNAWLQGTGKIIFKVPLDSSIFPSVKVGP